MANTITNNEGDMLGFYGDMLETLKSELIESIDNGHYEILEQYGEILEELGRYKESEELLILSENNGMGYTVKTYTESLKNN